ncbi:MAG: type II toxin-antitoxin system VapC family toxin [Bacteroidetes bacterium]|nr:type II toxin-antitoxin system VapC family toxin [Bacteroidota bacterium]
MKPCMLDTDVLSEFLRGNENVTAKAEEYLQEHGVISFSIITYYEVLNGLLYKDAKKQLEKFERFAEMSRIVPMTLRTVQISAKIQADLRKKGTVIGHTDTLIAGIAIANNLQLITNNTAHFSRIKKLKIDNWV